MGRLNKNIILFILCSVIVLLGLLSSGVIEEIKGTIYTFRDDLKVYGFTISFNNFADNIEEALSKNLSYHHTAMDINSVYNRYIGRRIIERGDITVIRADNGYLAGPRYEFTEYDVTWRARSVSSLVKAVEENGGKFLYIMAPTKGYSLSYPPNVKDYTASNCDRFIDLLNQYNVPNINLIESAKKDGISEEEMFFVTDHHWRPNMGLWACEKVSQKLNKEYDFSYDKELWNIENYNVKTYKDWFLGSQGKRVGRYFTPLGPDDIDLIVPKFETSITEHQPAKDSTREGTFSETLLYMENINVKDHYALNPYATYSGGDFREQIITNKLLPEGKTALIVRDSYGCAFTPFFSLAFSKLYVVDIRDGGYVGDKIHLTSYIKKLKPDYVFVLYTGISEGDSLYTFD